MVLTRSAELTNQAVLSDPDVRREQYEEVAILRYMMAVSFETGSPDEGKAAQSAHKETLPPEVGELSIQAGWMMIYFIDADAAPK